jgi:predicted small secreted protein
MKSNIIKTTALALMAALVVTLAGCNTIKGIGRDVSATGRGVTSGASATQRSM